MAYKSNLFPSGVSTLENAFFNKDNLLEDTFKLQNGYLWAVGESRYGGTLLDFQNLFNQGYSSPVQLISPSSWKEVASLAPYNQFIGANREFVAGIKTDGTLWTWGSNTKLTTASVARSSPIQIGTSRGWLKVQTGSGFNVHAIRHPGTLWGWGLNENGEIGDGTRIGRSSPVQIGSGIDWLDISHGFTGPVAALKENGTLWTWGHNLSGALGHGDTTSRSSPTQVGTATNWKKVSVGSTNIAAIKTDGSLWMSGKNLEGVLGNNQHTAYDTNVFEQIAVDTVWKEVTLGGKDADPTFASYSRDQTAYAIDVNNNLWCWGRYLTGALSSRSSPVQLTSFGNGWKTVKSAYNANVGIKTDGSLWTWGDSASDTFGFGIFNIGQYLPSQALIGTKGKWKKIDISKSGSGVNFGHQYGAGNIFVIEK